MPLAGHYLNSITSPVLTDQQKPGLLLFQNNKLTAMIRINLAPDTGKISRQQHKKAIQVQVKQDVLTCARLDRGKQVPCCTVRKSPGCVSIRNPNRVVSGTRSLPGLIHVPVSRCDAGNDQSDQ